MTEPDSNTTPESQPLSELRLDGSEAVNVAAETAKHTASRNIEELEGLPIPADTANLRQGPNISDALLALLPLVGVWRGKGQASTHVDGEYNFGQQIIFSHDGEDYLKYDARFWKLDEDGKPTGPDLRETGFWRINDKDEIEFTCCHSTGVVEIYYGEPVTERAWELEAGSTLVTATGPASIGPGKRLYGLMPNNDLGWVDERRHGDEYVPRMSAQLQRWAG
ncbi:FABP family protein [Corynebacterium ulceribovis]|uniref:FABP family protein n=1 Tax=Corynebacterium ulceribovis TaxID=487732 RepID=UPI000377047B|nr:FABP family protein [Corynebacterium ulceribovis]